jgi:Transposase DDE domain group 1
LRVKGNRAAPRFAVTCDGRGMTGRAGTALLAEAADAVGLTAGLMRAVGGCRRWAVHDPGKVVRDLVVTLADGGDALRHLAVLGGQDQEPLFGAVASAATANRTIVALAGDELVVERLAAARKAARAAVWAAGGAPPVVAQARAAQTDPAVDAPAEPLCVDLDATLVTAHSDDKDGAAPTYKRGWGFHPLLAYLDRGDGLGESLAGMLRPGNAGANTAGDHIDVFEAAVDQLGDLPATVTLVVRADSAGATREFLAYLRAAEVGFSVSLRRNPAIDHAIRAAHADPTRWTPATRQDGQTREGAAVAELTGTVDLSGWPEHSRLLVRREPLHPGAQQTLDDIDGHRFVCVLTDQPDADLAVLDTRHRAHARVEDRIRGAKDSGLRNLPCDTFDRNAVWLQLILSAQDLMTHTQVLTLDGDLRAAEPASLRYKLLHTPARLVSSGRRLILRIQHDWPWAGDLAAAFHRLRNLPLPAT